MVDIFSILIHTESNKIRSMQMEIGMVNGMRSYIQKEGSPKTDIFWRSRSLAPFVIQPINNGRSFLPEKSQVWAPNTVIHNYKEIILVCLRRVYRSKT